MTHEQWRREKRMMTGVILMMVGALDLIVFLIVFGSITLPHLEGRQFTASLTVLLIFLFISLGIGAAGVISLISGGFFKNIRERQLRIELAMIEQKRKAIEEANSSTTQVIPRSPRMNAEVEMIDVTEHTTRELRQ